MGKRENKVENYFKSEVKKIGGISRKWVSPGMDGVPDQIAIIEGAVWFVEIKTIDGILSPAQIREHKRLRDAGAKATTVRGHSGVDALIDLIKRGKI